MDQLFVLLGTLAGAVVGALGTWVVQRDVYRQQARDKQRDTERAAIVQWLVCSHDLYQITRAAQRKFVKDVDKAAYTAALDASHSAESLAALEQLRLVCDATVQDAAEQMWRHLRYEASRFTESVPPMSTREWDDAYWAIKRNLTNLAREALAP